MGVDASLYSTKAKTRCYFDRLYNITEYFELDDEERNSVANLYDKVMKHSMFFTEGLSKDETLKLINVNKKAWINSKKSYRYPSDRIFWLDKLERFVNSTGEDLYFIVTDHDDDWPDILDQYKEFEPE